MNATCTKVPYASRREAITSAPNEHGKPYRCSVCGAWHMGHAMPKKCKRAVKIKRNRRGTAAMLRLVDQLCGQEVLWG